MDGLLNLAKSSLSGALAVLKDQRLACQFLDTEVELPQTVSTNMKAFLGSSKCLTVAHVAVAYFPEAFDYALKNERVRNITDESDSLTVALFGGLADYRNALSVIADPTVSFQRNRVRVPHSFSCVFHHRCIVEFLKRPDLLWLDWGFSSTQAHNAVLLSKAFAAGLMDGHDDVLFARDKQGVSVLELIAGKHEDLAKKIVKNESYRNRETFLGTPIAHLAAEKFESVAEMALTDTSLASLADKKGRPLIHGVVTAHERLALLAFADDRLMQIRDSNGQTTAHLIGRFSCEAAKRMTKEPKDYYTTVVDKKGNTVMDMVRRRMAEGGCEGL